MCLKLYFKRSKQRTISFHIEDWSR